MRNLIIVILLLLAGGLFYFFSSGKDGPVSIKEVADNICECAQSVTSINHEIQELVDRGKIEEITPLMEKAGVAMEEAIACTKKQNATNLNNEELKKSLISACNMDARMAEDLVSEIIKE